MTHEQSSIARLWQNVQSSLAGYAAALDTYRSEASKVKEQFYGSLEQLGFERLNRFRTPGIVDGVGKNLVEVSAVPLSYGVRVDVNLPIQAYPTGNFQVVSCKTLRFLNQREELILTGDNTKSILERTVALSEEGSRIISDNINYLLKFQ